MENVQSSAPGRDDEQPVLPARGAESARRFPMMVFCALAVGVMALALYQGSRISRLTREVKTAEAQLAALKQRNDLVTLRLIALEAKDPAYGSAKVMVGWDAQLYHGVVSVENMPAAPAGHDYQLWVLDPTAPAPVSAGLLTKKSGSEGFEVRPVSTASPGFAISLEPSGGRPSPTGAILFAIAPGP